MSNASVTPDFVEKTVKQHLTTRQRKDRLKTQIAFYGGSFTGLDLEIQKSLLFKAHDFIKDGEVNSIRISTRPDYIDHNTMRFLKGYGVETIELGVQSMVDRILALSRRGHTSSDVETAVRTIKEHRLEIGLQIMPGLPGDTPELIVDTVDRVINMNPDFVRIYPTLIVRGTPLEELYSKGRFSPMTLDEAVNICKKALLRFENADIPVVRLGLQPTPELEKKGTIIAGPYHPSFRQLVESSIFFEMAARLIEKAPLHNGRPNFRINRKDYSYFCGQKNWNIARLKEEYRLKDIEITPDIGVKRGTLELMIGSSTFYTGRREPIH